MSGFTRRQVIGGAAAFVGAYVLANEAKNDDGDTVVPPTGGSETDMALHTDPEFVIADTNSDLDDFNPDGTGFAFVWDEQLTYKIT